MIDFFVFIGLQLATAVEPEDAKPKAVSKVEYQTIDQNLVKRAETAMTNLDAARGMFEQTDWDGTQKTGRFALRLPGKMRFDYSDESVIVISDGVTLSVRDNELDVTDAVPLAATPLGAVLSGSTRFDETTEIVRTHETDTHFFVTLQAKEDSWAGKLSLRFDRNDDRLTGWTTLDPAGAGTTVKLMDIDFEPKLNPRLFIVPE